MKNIGFIGLGTMGFPIAANLLEDGHRLYTGYHANRGPADQLGKSGAVVCSCYREIAENAEIIFTVVPSDMEVEAAIFGENGLWAGLRPGTIIIDMSTIDLTRSREFARRLAEKQVSFLDAPISGGGKGAQGRTLSIMVGGDEAAFSQCRDILQRLGKSVVYCGGSGLGLATKMANNLIAAATTLAISEATCLAVKAGVDPDDLYTVLKNGTAGSAILNGKMPLLLNDDYDPRFKLKLMCKDLGIITGVAKKLGTPAFLASTVEQVYSVCKKDFGEKDSCAVGLFYQEQAEVSFTSKKGSQG